MQSRPAGRLSRRELLAGGLAAAGAVTWGETVAAPAAASADATTTTPVSDASLLSAALGFEQVEIFCVRYIRRLRVASAAPTQRLLGTLLVQEHAHARLLAQELMAMGKPLPSPPTHPGQVSQVFSAHNISGDLTSLTTLKQAVQILLNAGALSEGAYYTAVGALQAPGPLVRAAQALASEGQHASLLTELIYPGRINDAVPAWYVAGVT